MYKLSFLQTESDFKSDRTRETSTIRVIECMGESCKKNKEEKLEIQNGEVSRGWIKVGVVGGEWDILPLLCQ